MAIALDIGGRTGGSMPSKKETAELKRYARELKMNNKSFGRELAQSRADGAGEARRKVEEIIAEARKKGDMSRVKRMIQIQAEIAKAEATKLQHELEMMKWHLVVDALSLVDPTPCSDGVSIWMDMQEAGM